MLFGKLCRLQQFIDAARPRTLREHWRDRRDNAGWSTLWAVMIIGFLGLLLGLMQVVLQLVQIIVSR